MPSSFAWSRDGENVAVSLIRCDCEREISIDSDGESNGDAGASSSLGKSSGKWENSHESQVLHREGSGDGMSEATDFAESDREILPSSWKVGIWIKNKSQM